MLNNIIMPVVIMVLCTLYIALEISAYIKHRQLTLQTSVVYEKLAETKSWMFVYLLIACFFGFIVYKEIFELNLTPNKNEMLNAASMTFMAIFFLIKAFATRFENVLYYTKDQIMIRNKVIKLRDIKELNRKGIRSFTYEIVTNEYQIRLNGLNKIPHKIDELYRAKKQKRR